MPETRFFAETALLPEGWARNVLFEIDPDGDLSAVTPDSELGGAPRAKGPVIPGMPNLHSHAFQRAMAGMAERAANPEDSFWTWREVMYGFVGRIAPEQLHAIAAQLYVEMLKAGYTAVGEFHYLHHQPGGQPYEDPAETSEQVIAAAEAAGIGITHLPVLYGFGGFGGQPAGEGQRRFLHEAADFVALIEKLMRDHGGKGNVRLGIAPHSLRAVTSESLRIALEGLAAQDESAPVHIHIAEQTKEVEDCVEWCGRRPVQWLLDEQPVDRRWCLVHATHMTEEETSRLAASGAVAGLCPTTEANLGDGLFNAPQYLAEGGAWGIGSDSHISISPLEELRWFEYGQRLVKRRRNVLRAEAEGHIGAGLYRAALAGGAQAMGRHIGRLEAGARADLLVLDPDSPLLAGMAGDMLLDALVFSGNACSIRDVMVGGAWSVTEGRHPKQEEIAASYRKTLKELTTA